MKDLKQFLNEKVYPYKMKDFEFSKTRGSKNDTYSFYHKPTGLEADIEMEEVGSRGRGQDLSTVDYLEFTSTNDDPSDETIEALETFINDNFGEIVKTAKTV